MNEIAPKILGNIDASDAAPALQQLLLAIDSTTILALTDEKGTILHVNDQFCKISKYSREELVGQNHRILRSGHHSRGFFIEMWRTIASGKTWNGEIKNTAKDGSYYWVETSIVPFRDDDGKITRYAAIRKDITDKKLLAEQIQMERAKSLNSEKMAALGEMAAGIAHEIGNPLGALRARIEMMKMKIENGQANNGALVKSCDQAFALIDRTTKIIRGLKSYARDASMDPMDEADIHGLIDEILEFSGPRLEKSKVKIQKELTDNDLRARCREAEISQVIVNLINNAVDVLKDQESRVITLRTFLQDNGYVRVEIEDSGPGVPEEKRARIFEPFFTTKAAGQGTGLGLSISKKIMQSHGGDLFLDEREGQTCFILFWPSGRN